MPTQKSELTVDLVIPVFNEAGVVEQTYSKICEAIRGLFHKFHIFFVDDGSSDGTADSLAALARQEKNITVLTLARNFGHQAALTAGLDASHGDFVISLDADGQHPPELIPQMIELFLQGYDIVQAQRIEGERTSTLKQLTSSAFYTLINRISGTQMTAG